VQQPAALFFAGMICASGSCTNGMTASVKDIGQTVSDELVLLVILLAIEQTVSAELRFSSIQLLQIAQTVSGKSQP
jgi:hypothetical protein